MKTRRAQPNPPGSPDRQNRSFRDALEQEARRIASTVHCADKDDPVVSALTHEITLVLDRLDLFRDFRADLRHHLLQSECAIGTELLQMETRTPPYSPYRYPEREKFQRQLLGLESERRRLAIDEEDQLRQLQDRLLSLVQRYRQLSF